MKYFLVNKGLTTTFNFGECQCIGVEHIRTAAIRIADARDVGVYDAFTRMDLKTRGSSRQRISVGGSLRQTFKPLITRDFEKAADVHSTKTQHG